MKKLTAYLFVSLLVVSLCFAQGTKEEGAKENGGLKGSIVMATNADEAQTSVIQSVIDKFLEENPGVSVEYVSYGKDYENLMKAKMAANDLPDIFATHGWAVNRYAEYLMPLNDLEAAKNLTPSIVGVVTTADGSIVSIPFTVDNKGIIYSQDALDKLGLSIPRTWDEFLECCEVAKNNGMVGVYLAGKDNRSMAQVYDTSAQTWLVTYPNGGKENQEALLDGSFDWTQWGRVAGFLKTLWDNGYTNKDANTADTVYQAEKLANAECLFMFRNWSEIQAALEINPGARLSMMPVPVWQEDDEPVLVGGEREAYGIWKDSENKEIAVALLEFMARSENATYIAEGTGMPSGFAHIDPDLPLFKEFQKYSNLRTMPIFDREWLPSGMWATMRTTGAGITSGMSVEEAVKAMEDSYNNLREQNN